MGKLWDNIKKSFRKFMSPVFLTMLVISLIIWYLTKLGHTYTADVPLNVNVDGNRFRIECIAEGRGYRIVSQRYFRKGEISIPFRELQVTPSVINAGSYVISAYSFQNAVSARVSDLRIVSVGELPEIRIPYTQ